MSFGLSFRPAVLAQTGSNAALIAFLIYTLGVFGLAAVSNQLLKKKSFLSEYFLGSRSLGVWAFALTFAATSASGGSFTGFPSKIYTHGWILGLWIGSYIVVPICAMGLLGKRLNQIARLSGAITVPDVLRDRFHSAKFGLLAVSLIVFFMSFNLVAQFKAGSEILNTLLRGVGPFDETVGWLARAKADVGFLEKVDPAYLLCLLTFALAVVAYTTYGGFHAVVWTDVMQGVVMVLGVVLMLPLAIRAVGGLENATRQMARMTPPRLGLARFETEVPSTEDLALNSPWFTLPGQDGSRPRLFRVNKTLALPANETTVEQVKFVEITTPAEIDAQLKRLADPAQYDIDSFNDKLREFKRHQIRWVELHRDSLERPDETIRKLERDLEAISRNRVALLMTPEFQPLKVSITLNKEYAYGSGRRGLYVSGPGPAPPTLPKEPGTLDLHVDAAGAEVRILDSNGTLEVVRENVGRETLIALEKGRHTVKVLKDGYEPFEEEITMAPDATRTVDARLVASEGEEHPPAEAEKQPASSFGFLPLSIAISFFFMWAISGAGQPSSMVRLMAFNSATTLRRAIFTVAIYYSMIYFPLVIIFCCARVLLPGMDLESDRIMPQMAVTLTQTIGQGWLAGLLVAAPFAAVMSTVDSFLLMISSALVRDIYQRNINPEAPEKRIKRLSFFFTAVVGTGAMLGAINPPQFLQDIIVYTGSGLAACFLGPMVFALYWPRANTVGCMAGMLAGFGAHLSMYVTGKFVNGSFYDPYQLFNFNPIVVGLVVSFVTCYVVTRLTPPPPQDIVRKYFHKSQ